jgi:hypothetical protein
MTKAQRTERDEARAQLREWIKPGDTVYTILDSVSRSGMSRQIRVVIPYTREDGTIDHLHPNYSVAKALGLRQATKGDGIIMGGCGMDMGFALVYELSHALYGAGYPCLGKGQCPSNYHVNHRDTIRCEGTRVHNPDGPDFGSFCYRPNSTMFGPRVEIPEDWPRRQVEIDGEIIDGGPLYCITDEQGENPQVCPTCHGAGSLPNPEGPERFDLIHTDGYAVRHRWL